jgi:hypothetical protein
VPLGACLGESRLINAFAVVSNSQTALLIVVPNLDFHVLRLRVPEGISQGLAAIL